MLKFKDASGNLVGVLEDEVSAPIMVKKEKIEQVEDKAELEETGEEDGDNADDDDV